MNTLRLIATTVIDSRNISAKFTENLSTKLTPDNVSIISQTDGVADCKILSVSVINNVLNIFSQPLTSQAAYFITFQSTTDVLFTSLNADSILFNSDISNRELIIGPVEPNNAVKTYFINFLRNNVYSTDDPSIISKYIEALSIVLSKSLYDVGQVKNENYLSFTVIDEIKTRGDGPFDRLNEESVYDISRVGLKATGAKTSNITSINDFPVYPISLLSVENTENILVNSSDNSGTFNINSFTITTSKYPVIKLNQIIFVYNSILPPYIYDIEKYGYTVNNSKYDPNFSFTYIPLQENQIKLNDKILNDDNFSLDNISYIKTVYEFKDLGKVIDPKTLSISTFISSGREVLPPIENNFTLLHAPVVSSSNKDGSIGDIQFLDPNSLPGSNTAHPAFTNEILFRLDYLPSNIGEYSVDYSTGNVYVYGNNIGKSGTGAFPPLGIYKYKYTFKINIDYVYDEETSDVVALPNGNLINSISNIVYNYEKVLSKNIDFIANIHNEALNERIENRLVALNALKPLNTPITNVFRIFNETTGEIYRLLRWTNNLIYFTSQKPPSIISNTGEKVLFSNITNDILSVSEYLEISSTEKIFKILLNNNNVAASTEDGIGYSKNTSVKFSDTNIFTNEIYFDSNLSIDVNNGRLLAVGDYQIDYYNGIVWTKVNIDQNFSIGTITYKIAKITPINPHIISVEDIYYRLSILDPKSKSFNYSSFGEGEIIPSTNDNTDELYLAGSDPILPYQLSNTVIGVFDDAIFTPGISNYIKYIRAIYEYNDLINNQAPLNFSISSTFNGKNITVSPLQFSEYQVVDFDGVDYFILLNNNLSYMSVNITMDISVIRLSDSLDLWDGGGTVQLGTPIKLILSGTNSPQVGDNVLINYSFEINDLSRILVDYNKGDYYIDYSYLYDEIIISYEYGDNVLDFRQSETLSPGDKYYVSYKVGALRDALLRNFGTLIDIPILNNLNVDFERERYRDALMATMQSFTQGPTVSSLKNIVSKIVHTPPEVIESAFQNWSLGNSLLNPELVKVEGDIELLTGKYGNGVSLTNSDQSISFPTISNLKLEQGSLEMWLSPNWNGLDNQSNLTFTILKNNIAIKPQNIFIGPAGYHPEINNSSFTLTKDDQIFGKPNENEDGVFIYLAPDTSGLYNKWYLDIKDGYSDGYDIKNYSVKIINDGKFYNVKSNNSSSSNYKLITGTNSILFTTSEIPNIDGGINFIADYQHYLFDFGKDEGINRFSIFKDESGYINFRIIDKNKISYIIDADISDWVAGELHHIAVSWALNSVNNRDEMHLFIDGFEVPNIIKYNNFNTPNFHEKFRVINSDEIIGSSPRPIVGSIDLITTFGFNEVSSSLDFTAYNILVGDIIYIEGNEFSTLGYTIINVNGNTLTLSDNMPITSTDTKFSINKTSLYINEDIGLYKNIFISLLHSIKNGNDLQVVLNSNSVSSTSVNFETLEILPGYLLKIDETGFENYYVISNVSGNILTLVDDMPLNFSNAAFLIYSNLEEEIPGQRALRPSYSISDSDGYDTLTLTNNILKDDIILIKTLGLNHKEINNKYYIWGNVSNVIMTRMAPPVNLNSVKITHILSNNLIINSDNSTTISSNFTSDNILTDQPSNSDNGRTISVYVSSNNIDYSASLLFEIFGTINGASSSSTTLSFSKNGTLITTDKISQIDYFVVSGKIINPSNNYLTIKISEALPITEAENSTSVPIIRYSYQMSSGNTLSGTSGAHTITDNNNAFSVENIDNYLIVHYPPSVAGQYKITGISTDLKTLTINGTLAATFSNGIYEILNTTTANSGMQNGFLTLEEAENIGEPYILTQGLYEIKYFTYLSIKIEADKTDCFIGTDFNKTKIANGIIDEFIIYSEKFTDTRIGEITLSSQNSITKDFNSLKELNPKSNILMLLHFNQLPIANEAEVYILNDNKLIQSDIGVNDNFNQSIVIKNNPLIIDNSGILNTKTEGTIEFWISPLFDTMNDPNYRFYFDASSIVREKSISINNSTIELSGKASNVLSVNLQNGNTTTNYFTGGVIDSNGTTIFLDQELPNQQTKITTTYIPTGVNGDRISIYKDPFGYINFNVRADGIDNIIRTPVFWSVGQWHRVRAQYRLNSIDNSDQIKLFIDGYEQGNILFGNGLLFGQNQVYGSSFIGDNNISRTLTFRDTINQLYVGSDYTKTLNAYAMIDNFKISNIFRPVFVSFGEAIDTGYSSNLSIVIPATQDLNTTLLLDFDTLLTKNTNFATLKNKITGLFDITVNIFDSFDIVKENAKIKEILETLINTLKPAVSRVYIKYK